VNVVISASRKVQPNSKRVYPPVYNPGGNAEGSLGSADYFFGDCLAEAAACFFWLALLLAVCFCFACFCTDFGDLSPIIFFCLSCCPL
jgi:hypothetical protein